MSTPNSSQNEVVVLMPAHNEAQTIAASIQAVNSSENLNHSLHTIVGVNACTDNTVEVLEALKTKHKSLEYVMEAVPGKPRALNALLDRAEMTHRMGSEDVVLFLDANAQVQENTISDLAIMLKHDKSLNAVSANELSLPPQSDSILSHLLFGVSELSLSSLALRDRKSSCMAVRASKVKGVRFPEHVMADDLWLSMYLGMDSVETHPDAFVTVQSPKNFLEFAGKSVKHMVGLYQLEEFFPAHEVREHLPTGTHEHVEAFLREPELQNEFVRLPGVYQLSSALALPIHAALKTIAWVAYRLSPQPKNHSTPIPRHAPSPAHSPARA